jgi:hypothetical protein
LTPGDGADPRTFPAIFNATADEIEAQGTAIADLEDLNPVQFGTAVASGGQVLAFSTAVSGYSPADVFGAAVNGTAVYRFVSTVYFTSSGTFSKADYPWLRAIRVKVQGAGGGGGGCGTTAATSVALGSAGGGGSYSESFITDIAGLDASVTVTRGAGGAGGAAGNNAGTAGGASSFGALVTTNGGLGGSGSAAQTPLVTNAYTTGSAANSTAGLGDFVLEGPGSAAPLALHSFTNVFPPVIPGTFLGSAKRPGNTTTGYAGATGLLYGCGGEGGTNALSQVTARAGGAGGNGIVIVELYA